MFPSQRPRCSRSRRVGSPWRSRSATGSRKMPPGAYAIGRAAVGAGGRGQSLRNIGWPVRRTGLYERICRPCIRPTRERFAAGHFHSTVKRTISRYRSRANHLPTAARSGPPRNPLDSRGLDPSDSQGCASVYRSHPVDPRRSPFIPVDRLSSKELRALRDTAAHACCHWHRRSRLACTVGRERKRERTLSCTVATSRKTTATHDASRDTKAPPSRDQ